jgi:hypothetical protein
LEIKSIRSLISDVFISDWLDDPDAEVVRDIFDIFLTGVFEGRLLLISFI